jgi:hypothetical protein
VRRKDGSTEDCKVVVKDGSVQSCECLEWHKRILCRHMLLVAWTLTERQVAKGNKQGFAGKVSPHVSPLMAFGSRSTHKSSRL